MEILNRTHFHWKTPRMYAKKSQVENKKHKMKGGKSTIEEQSLNNFIILKSASNSYQARTRTRKGFLAINGHWFLLATVVMCLALVHVISRKCEKRKENSIRSRHKKGHVRAKNRTNDTDQCVEWEYALAKRCDCTISCYKSTNLSSKYY